MLFAPRRELTSEPILRSVKVVFIKCNVQQFKHYCSKVQATCCAMTKGFVGGFQCRDLNQSSVD